MKRILLIAIILMLYAGELMAEELKQLSLDDAATIGTTIQTDSEAKVEGIGSVRITTLYPTTICLAEITDINVENSRLVYRATVKSALEGTAYLEMWAHVRGGRYFSRGMNNPVKGRSDWISLQTPFVFQKGQTPDKLTLNLVINGTGTVWIDDIVLSKVPLQ